MILIASVSAKRVFISLAVFQKGPAASLTDHVLEYDVPSDDERPKLADAHVGVHVCGASFRYARAELGVTQRGQHGRSAGQHERQNDRRTGHFFRHSTDQHVDPGAHHVTDPCW